MQSIHGRSPRQVLKDRRSFNIMSDYYRSSSQPGYLPPARENIAPTMAMLSIQTPIRSGKAANDLRIGSTGAVGGDVLSQAYFSPQNVKIVQNGIRRQVYELSNGTCNVPPPDPTQLLMAMHDVLERFVFFLPEDITQEIERLNNITITAASKKLIQKIEHETYFQSVHMKVCTPMNNPQIVDRDYSSKDIDCTQQMGRNRANGAVNYKLIEYTFGHGRGL